MQRINPVLTIVSLFFTCVFFSMTIMALWIGIICSCAFFIIKQLVHITKLHHLKMGIMNVIDRVKYLFYSRRIRRIS